jgi:hypothetical protein
MLQSNNDVGPLRFGAAQSSDLACQALNIVLKKWLVPELGWSVEGLKGDITHLKTQIKEESMKIFYEANHSEEEKQREIEQLDKKLARNPLTQSTTDFFTSITQRVDLDFVSGRMDAYLPERLSVSSA